MNFKNWTLSLLWTPLCWAWLCWSRHTSGEGDIRQPAPSGGGLAPSLLTVIPTLRRSSYRQHQLAHIIAQCCRSWAGPGYRGLHSYTPPPAPSTNPAHSGARFALLWGGGLLLNFPLFLESTAATPFHCQHLAPDKSQMIFILTETRFLLTLQFYTKST